MPWHDGAKPIEPFFLGINFHPVRLAYQPPASSTFLSEQTSHQQPANSTFLSQQISTSHQPPAKRTGCLFVDYQVLIVNSMVQWNLYSCLRDSAGRLPFTCSSTFTELEACA
jgi:hypothetical protein